MELVWLLKPLFDMLYEYQVLDVILMGLCLLMFCLRRQRGRFCVVDALMVVLALLFAYSFYRDTKGLNDFLKIESGFVLYFLGRKYAWSWQRAYVCLRVGFLVVLAASYQSYIDETGFKLWGHVNTFTGLYFFKTDLAAAMAQCFIAFAFVKRLFRRNIVWQALVYAVLGINVMLILYSNARAYYIIIFVLLVLMLAYFWEMWTKRRIKLNWKTYLLLGLVVAGTVYGMNYLSERGLASDYLLVSFEDTSELLDANNTQGRSKAWSNILGYFFTQDLETRMVGIDLVKDLELGEICESHNLYIKILFATGYLGSACFLLILFFCARFLNRLRDGRLFFVVVAFMATYLLSGISYSSIISTQLSWYPMYFLGVGISMAIQDTDQSRKRLRHG